YLSHLDALRDVPCTTRCGERVYLRANVGLAQDVEDYATSGAEGIGLYRTEIFYLMRTSRPTTEELADSYGKVLTATAGQTVIFRTLDLGGEHFPPYLEFAPEENPVLGLRSLRFQLRRQALFKEQLKGLLRVAHLGDMRVMFPMISQLDELLEAKAILNQCRDELVEELGRPVPLPKVGMMFEVPAAVLKSELFVSELDFMAVGSNDLTQYVLAVDRNNPQVSHLYDPLDPAVLLLVKRLVDTARAAGKPLELCGEVASDPDGCLVLVGLGLRELSMNAPLIPIVKDRLSHFTLAELENLASMALMATSAAAVRRNLQVLAPRPS
ncbi:MAG TPA: putative PEP-binding protein, partial [bacterium]|nr:putative PEP-binding protein [bacterium]